MTEPAPLPPAGKTPAASPPPSSGAGTTGHGAHHHPGPKVGLAILKDLIVEPLNWLLVALPILAVVKVLYPEAQTAIFVLACLSVIPLAGLMGRATENLSETMGPGLGGLLNSTFGNAAELIIALMAIHQQKFEFVKATITGSIIGNILLVMGAAFIAGGVRYKKQKFNATAAGMSSTLMALAGIGMLMPSFYYYSMQFENLLQGRPTAAAHAPAEPGAAAAPAPAAGVPTETSRRIDNLSEEISVVLLLAYVCSLIFSLRTHRHLYDGDDPLPTMGEHHQPEWSQGTSLAVLLIATVGVAWASEALVGSVESAAHALGFSELFIGVIVVAIVGNAAEHSTAIMVAYKGKMDLAVNIAVGSSIQVALFVVPTLVFASVLMGHGDAMDLNFTPLEIVSVLATIGVLAIVCADGESNWMEGVMLLAVYATIALVCYNWPDPHAASHAPGTHPHPPAATATASPGGTH